MFLYYIKTIKKIFLLAKKLNNKISLKGRKYGYFFKSSYYQQ